MVKFKALGQENLSYDDKTPFRIEELGLHQREVEKDGQTRVVVRIRQDTSFPFFFYNDSSFEALATNTVKNQNYFHFQVDPKFSQNDKTWKTVIIDLPNVDFKQKFEKNMEFAIYNDGKEDLTVTFVRLIKE